MVEIKKTTKNLSYDVSVDNRYIGYIDLEKGELMVTSDVAIKDINEAYKTFHYKDLHIYNAQQDLWIM